MKKSNARLYMFFRRNAVYLVLGFCILAVALSITFMLINKQNNSQISADNDTPPVQTPVDPDLNQPEQPVVNTISFIMPVNNSTSISEYSEVMVWNSTLGRYSAHQAMDFFASEGAEVLAVLDGTVKSVESSFLQGTTVTIDHGNGLVTKYNSLADGENVSVGQSVTQGQVIGHVSSSNRQEQASGAHLHFEVFEKDVAIDPAKYLDFGEK